MLVNFVRVFIFLIMIGSANLVVGQVPWDYQSTNKKHTIQIPQSLNIAVEGKKLSANDAVGVFYNDGNSMKCGGYKLWKDLKQQDSLIAYGAEGSKRGFNQGDSLFVKVWDNSLQCSIDAVEIEYDGRFSAPYFKAGSKSQWSSWSAIKGEASYGDTILCVNNPKQVEPELNNITRDISFKEAEQRSGLAIAENSGVIKPFQSKIDTYQIKKITTQCLKSQTQPIIIADTPSFSIKLNKPLCEGSKTKLLANQPSNGNSIEWLNTSNTSDSLVISEPGTYKAVATNKDGCSDTVSINPKAFEKPEVAIKKDTIQSCQPAKVQIQQDKAGEQVKWSNGASGGEARVSKTQELIATRVDTNGCRNADTIYARISKGLGFQQLDPTIRPVTCEGQKGMIAVEAISGKINGGVPPYKVQLVKSNSGAIGKPKRKATFQSLDEGTYNLQVQDHIGCNTTYSETFSIRKQQCSDPVVVVNGQNGDEPYFIPYEGKAEIYNRQGELEATLETPKRWFGRDANGKRLPLGVYHVVVNNDKHILVTIIR